MTNELTNLFNIACTVLDIDSSDSLLNSRKRTYVTAKKLYCYFCDEIWKQEKFSLRQIGEGMNCKGKDHSSILYNIKTVKDAISVNDKLLAPLVVIMRKLISENDLTAMPIGFLPNLMRSISFHKLGIQELIDTKHEMYIKYYELCQLIIKLENNEKSEKEN